MLAALHGVTRDQLFEARRLLEGGVAGLAAERASPEQLAAMADEVAGMFAARGFNIDSLSVAETQDPTASRMTIVTRGLALEQVVRGNALRLLYKELGVGLMNGLLWGALVGPSVIGACQRLSPGEDGDALARDVLETTLAGLRAGVPLTFRPSICDGRPAGVASGVVSHES